MQLATARKVFASLMKKSREGGRLTELEHRTLSRASQTIRAHAKPAMNPHLRFFKTRVDAESFIKKMRKKKVYAHLRPAREHGLYVVEAPKKSERNPETPSKAVKIYGRCLRIEAVKMRSHLYGGKKTAATQKYFHDFTTKNAMIYGLPDGSLLIKAR